jgi:phage-related holin
MTVLAPIKPVMITVGVLIILDLVIGIMAALKRKEHISSAALRRTISKLVIYQVAVISGFICETYLIDHLIPISKLVAGMIGAVELKSILENANEVNGEPIFNKLIKSLGSVNDKIE